MSKSRKNTALAVCPLCGVAVRATRFESHLVLQCPKAPDAIVALRPRKPKSGRRHIKSAETIGSAGDYERGLQKVAYAAYVRAQRDSMSD